MRKRTTFLLCLLGILLGFVGGVFAATRYWVSPNDVFNRVAADGFRNLDTLSDLRNSNTDAVIQSNEIELDACILGLGAFAQNGGENGKRALVLLRKISRYRSKVSYAPKGSGIAEPIRAALALADEHKP
jgi:hypothetical protein